MKRLYLLILLVLTAIVSGYGQYADNPAPDVDEPSGQESGEVQSITDVPVEVNVPQGFKLLDKETTINILVSWENTPSELSDIVGMIIPDTIAVPASTNRAWVISYRKSGHVKDDNAADMSFEWILNEMRESSEEPNVKYAWAWNPNYDSSHHRLSLPMMEISGSDTTLIHQQFIFGNSGVIRVVPAASYSDTDWVKENDEKINDAISFAQGERYEDFDSSVNPVFYYSVSDFLKGKPGGYHETSSDATAEEGGVTVCPVRKPGLIIIISIIALVLIVLMLLLMLAVAITNKKSETSKDIMLSGVNVLLRIGVFAMVYLLILLFAILLIWAGVKLTTVIVTHVISVRIIIGIVVGWIFIIGFLYGVIKSLFSFSRENNPYRMEITRSEAPELFALIEEISSRSGEKMPKHVYLSPHVNACVFYDRPFLSLFMPGRKNLEVGLGLFFGLNRQELIAVIGHEYGHFGQKSMRVGQVISVCYRIISNLANSEKTSIVRPIISKTYSYVQRGFMRLSRSMEYEADEKSAMIAGKEATVSALCKIEIMAERFNAYNSVVQSIYEAKKIIPASYWEGYRQFSTLTENLDGIALDMSVVAAAPLSHSPKSKVNLKNPWLSHPLLEDRIENIRKSRSERTSESPVDISRIVPEQLYAKMSAILFEVAEYYDGKTVEDSEYLALLANDMDERSFPLELRSFFSRDIRVFEISKNEKDSAAVAYEDAFSARNAGIVESFTQAISDYQVMAMFKNKQLSEKVMQYDGHVYNRKNVPLEKQYEIIENLEPQVVAIDKAICLYTLSKADDKQLILKAYDDIFYSQAIIRHIEEKVMPERDYIAGRIGSGGKTNEEVYNRTQQMLKSFQAGLIQLIIGLEMDRLNPVMHVDMAKHFKLIEEDWLFDGDSIDGEMLVYIFSLPDHLIGEFRNLAFYSKKIVTDIIEGKAPLMYWNNSVAASKENEENEK